MDAPPDAVVHARNLWLVIADHPNFVCRRERVWPLVWPACHNVLATQQAFDHALIDFLTVWQLVCNDQPFAFEHGLFVIHGGICIATTQQSVHINHSAKLVTQQKAQHHQAGGLSVSAQPVAEKEGIVVHEPGHAVPDNSPPVVYHVLIFGKCAEQERIECWALCCGIVPDG